MIYGEGDFRYERVEGWGEQLVDWDDSSWGLRKVSGLGADKDDRIYWLTRSDRPILITDKDGNLLEQWGEGLFDTPHGATIDDDGNFFCVDVEGHMVHKFDKHGKLVLTLGRRGHPSDTGADYKPMHEMPDYRTIKRAAGPFHAPTNLAIAPKNGDLYISDGYGNCRVHRFTKSGAYVQSWGEPGVGPGQFHMPHGILVGPNDVVYVADRENGRIQLFDLFGHFLEEWTFLFRPSHMILGRDGLMYVCECKQTDVFDGSPSAIRILTLEGKQVALLDNGVGAQPGKPYRAGHAMCIDSEGSIYLGYVGKVPEGFFGISKYRRV